MMPGGHALPRRPRSVALLPPRAKAAPPTRVRAIRHVSCSPEPLQESLIVYLIDFTFGAIGGSGRAVRMGVGGDQHLASLLKKLDAFPKQVGSGHEAIGRELCASPHPTASGTVAKRLCRRKCDGITADGQPVCQRLCSERRQRQQRIWATQGGISVQPRQAPHQLPVEA